MTGKSNTQQKPKYQAGNYFTIHGSLEKGNPSPGAMGGDFMGDIRLEF